MQLKYAATVHNNRQSHMQMSNQTKTQIDSTRNMIHIYKSDRRNIEV